MALTRRQWLRTLPVVAGALAACTQASQVKKPTAGDYRELLRAGQGGRERVVVFMPDTPQTREVWTGLADELSEEVELIAVRVESAREAQAIARAMELHKPAGLVLINNPTVAAYREYQRAAGAKKFPPAVILMTSLLEQEGLDLRNATGVRYEVPLVSVVTNLRRLIATPIQRVGVIHRDPFTRLVSFEARLAEREKVTLVTERVSREPNESEIKRALRRIKQRADVLWVLNDDRLLTPRLLAQGWIPGLNERPFIPTIVGVRSLVSAQGAFGTFAVLPDHTSFGAQAADILFDAAENGWSFADTHIELPLSTTTIVDVAQASERFALREGALSQVDVILGQAATR